ncbi:MAG: transposase [Thermaerobacter sp.]|nr:transposase [Thermaerobacter sp.]
MEVRFSRCADLAIHKKMVVAGVRGETPSEDRPLFGTPTAQWHTLAPWLTEPRATHVAMESTTNYWKPVFNLLEPTFNTWLVDPAHINQVPGRKTDIKDSEGIADRLQLGLRRPRCGN